eukprot:3710002-Rhodomonas_salina.3
MAVISIAAASLVRFILNDLIRSVHPAVFLVLPLSSSACAPRAAGPGRLCCCASRVLCCCWSMR